MSIFITSVVISGCSSGGDSTSTLGSNLVYELGDTGPGGGNVFYFSSIPFSSPGSECNTSCHYLEAAPSDFPNTFAWCSDTETFLSISEEGIGFGMSNTSTSNFYCTSGAVQLAADFKNNGLEDWFLPSLDELGQMFINRNSVGGLSTGGYWSSSEYDDSNGYTVSNRSRYLNFGDGDLSATLKVNPLHVRPVRAF